MQLPTYGHERRTHNRYCFSTSATASSAADPASTEGLPPFFQYQYSSVMSYVHGSEGNHIPVRLLLNGLESQALPELRMHSA